MKNIPFLSLQQVTAMHGEEIETAVNNVIRKGWYLLGEEVSAFEAEYARYIGTNHCVACANGLDALRLIIMAYKEMGMLCEGDEVIVPANTYIATILAITENGLTPILIEPSSATLQIDDTLIEQHITPRTKAIMIVHLYGICSYTDRISELCQCHGLLLFEDNAQAQGAEFSSASSNSQTENITQANQPIRRTGSLGDAAAHSFYPGKNLGALGDGGAITTNDPAIANILRTLANYGSSKKYVFDYQGINSRLDEIQAAVLRVKLHYLDHDNNQRRTIARHYCETIKSNSIIIPHAVKNVEQKNTSKENVYHIFPILCLERDRLQQHLLAHGVSTQIHYPIPPHQQRCYSSWNHLSLPITESIARQELSLPIAPYMTEADVLQVAEAINSFV